MIAGVGLLARRRISPGVGVLTAAILAIWPNQVLSAPLAMTEGLFTPVFAAAIIVLFWRRRATLVSLLAGGALLGCASLVRPAGAPAVVVIACILAWQSRSHRPWRPALLVGGAALVVMAPWLAYTGAELGRPTLSTFTGYNLCQGNSDGATGSFGPTRCMGPEGEDSAVTDRAQQSEAVRWILRHPFAQTRLVPARLVATFVYDDYWSSEPVPGSYEVPLPEAQLSVLIGFWWVAMVVLAAVGAARERRVRPMLAAWASVLVGPLVTIGDPRFHDALVPAVAMCVAVTLEGPCRRYWSRRADRGAAVRSA